MHYCLQNLAHYKQITSLDEEWWCLLPEGMRKKRVPKAAAVCPPHHLVCSLQPNIQNQHKASCNNTIQRLKALWFDAHLNRVKVALPNQAWRCPLTGIPVPHIRCYTTKGNPSQSRICFQHDVCKRLVRRGVIEGRKGWCVLGGWSRFLSRG